MDWQLKLKWMKKRKECIRHELKKKDAHKHTFAKLDLYKRKSTFSSESKFLDISSKEVKSISFVSTIFVRCFYLPFFVHFPFHSSYKYTHTRSNIFWMEHFSIKKNKIHLNVTWNVSHVRLLSCHLICLCINIDVYFLPFNWCAVCTFANH